MAMETIFAVSTQREALTELCAGAGALAPHVTAVLFGTPEEAQAAAGCGAEQVLYCPAADGVRPEDYAAVIAAEVKKAPSALVMVYNDIRGRCLAGMIGALLDTSVLTGISGIEAGAEGIVCRRMVYGGTAHRRTVFVKPYGVVTVGSGLFEAPAAGGAPAPVAALACAAQPGMQRIALHEKKERVVNLVAAKRIVDVGRGLAAEADLELCRRLAAALGAEVGCSRPMAENNKWMPKSCYMGITGVQVKPELIVVLGVSGQVQHIGGINKSRVIVAVNKDKAAPIFKNADFGLVGDLYKVVPALIEKLS